MLFDYIRAGMILNEDVTDDRGNLLLETGTVLTDNYLVRLRNTGFRQLRIVDPYAASLRPRTAIPEKLREELSLCFRSLLSMRWGQDQGEQLRYMYLQRIDATVKQVISHLETQIPDVINLPVRQPTEDEVSHSVNVCLLSTITGLYLRFPASVLSDLAIGALLHDIGKTAILDKPSQEGLYTHALYGHDLLLANKFNQTVARIAAEHHECPDGSGYPRGMQGTEIHPLSRLVSVANFYDRVISQEEEDELSRQEIVEAMMANGNAVFDLNMLRAFFQTIAVFPVGSLVKLNSGKLAYVLRNKTHMPLRPCVELVDESRCEIDLSSRPDVIIEELIQE